MDTRASLEGGGPDMFQTSAHFCDAVNRNVVQSEVEGGVYLRDLRPGSTLLFETRNRVYEMVFLGDRAAMISGHPRFCPEPVKVEIAGSTWGGSMIKLKFIGRGMRLEFEHPVHHRVITSAIVEIREQ
jgi:hypothetical protein